MKNTKPPRSDDEVRKLAAAWASKWTAADGIEPWLRRHMDEMKRMIRVDRWSWSDLARSLNEAGITYAGGQWTAALLGDKVATLRWRQRKRERAAAPQHTFPVEFLREALGNLGSIQQLVVNVQGTAAGPMTATLSGQPVAAPIAPVLPPVAAPVPALVASPAAVVKQPVPPAPSSNEAEPPRRTFSFATPRGLDPVAKAPSPPPANAETPTPAAPTVNADDVLARFAPGATRR